MTPDEIRTLPTQRIGRTLHRYHTLPSTNALALQLAEEESTPDGLVIVADEQTAGRGQHGRTWHSPPATSVLMSVLLRVPPHLRDPVRLTAWAAVAVCDMIAEITQLTPTIKWPNDVLIGGKKVCGILLEQRRLTVSGIGLNVSQSRAHFEQATLPDAASLAIASGRDDFDLDAIIYQLCAHLDNRYQQLLDGGEADLEQSWRQRLDLIDRWVRIEQHDGTQLGRIVDVRFDRVLAQLPDRGHESVALAPARILHLSACEQGGNPLSP